MASLNGTITSFGNDKGYGFISCDSMSDDIFFSRRALPSELHAKDGFPGFHLRGKSVTFEQGEPSAEGKPTASKVSFNIAEGEQCLGTVLSYVSSKGYGFIGVSNFESHDFFFAARDVPPHMKMMNLKGMTAMFTVRIDNDKPRAENIQFKQMPMMDMMQSQFKQMPMMGMMQQNVGMPMMPKMKGVATEGQGMQGVVTSFDSARGFGFLQSGAHDNIYFKDTTDQFSAGDQVAFKLKIMPDGKFQAREIMPGMSEGVHVGTITSYNNATGWGFIAVEGYPAEVYFKKESFPAHQQELIQRNAMVQVNVALTMDGKPQASAVRSLGTSATPSPQFMSGMKRPMRNGGAMQTVPPKSSKRMRAANGHCGGPVNGQCCPTGGPKRAPPKRFRVTS